MKHTPVMFFLFLFFFTSCGVNRPSGKSEKSHYDAAPEWVNQRPHDVSCFIGVGSCSKKAQPLDYQTIAKKNALNDLATEISVRVQGETTMNTQEYNKSFSEDFLSSIRTSTDATIEDYEVAGIWENENDYWIFYRLNKAQYHSKRRDKKSQALSAGFDYWNKGISASLEGNITGAFDLYMHGLFAIKDYWSEPNDMVVPTGKIFLDNELMNSMRSLFSKMKIEASADKVILNSKNEFREELSARVKCGDITARAIPVSYVYEHENFMKPRVVFTSEMGDIRIQVEKVSTISKLNQLKIAVEPELFLADDLDKSMQRALIKGIRGQQLNVQIDFIPPAFFVSMNDSDNNMLSLKNTFSSEIQKRGYRSSVLERESNYVVVIKSTLKPGGSADGFVMQFLDIEVEVKDNPSGTPVYSEVLTSIKGVGINALGATADVYKRARERLEQQIVPSMCKVLF